MPADDTMEEKLDVSIEGLDLPDIPFPNNVIDWDEDPTSGVHYRRLTEMEIESNGWHGNLLLVALEDDFVADVSTAVAKVTLDLPLADAHPLSLQENLPIISVPLVHQSSRDFAGSVQHFVKATGVAVVTAKRPVFHSYIQKYLDWGTVDDTAVHLFAQDDGGIVVSGATYGRTFWLEGPQEDFLDLITIDIEPEPGRQAFLLHTEHGLPLSQLQVDEDAAAAHIQNRRSTPPISSVAASAPMIAGGAPSEINQCTDGLNNDPEIDDVADGCDFSCMPHPDFGTDSYPGVFPIWEYARPFAVVGDAEWCTTHVNDWEDLLHSYGRTAEEMLNWVEAPTTVFPGPRVPPFRLVGLYCWVFEDLDDALECHNNGNCPTGYEDYPFKNVGTTWSSGNNANTYLDKVWSATDAWATDAVLEGAPDVVHPLQNVVVVVYRQDPNENPEVAGLASLGNTMPYSRAGGSVALGIDWLGDSWGGDLHPILIGRITAHEFGHTHGLTHDPTTFDGVPGFMATGGGAAPILGENVDSNIINHEVPATNPPTMYTQYQAWTKVAPLKRSPRPAGFSHVGCDTNPDNCPTGLTCTDTVQGFACLP
jgi:hypothetical protein